MSADPATSLAWPDDTRILHQTIKGDTCQDDEGRARPSILAEHGEKLVRIWSSEHGWYWGPNGGGYVGFDTAGIYTLKDAWSRTSHCGPEKMIEYHPAIYESQRDHERARTATDEPLALLQTRRWFLAYIPPGVVYDGEYYVWEDEPNDDPTPLGYHELVETDSESIVEWWDTHRVFLSQDEAREWGEARKHRWPDGWRVYSVPARGKLRTLAAGGPGAAKVLRGGES